MLGVRPGGQPLPDFSGSGGLTFLTLALPDFSARHCLTCLTLAYWVCGTRPSLSERERAQTHQIGELVINLV
jgi:hypothetical protein